MKKTVITSAGIIFLITLLAFSQPVDPDLIFSHKYHHEEVGAGCAACHETAFESEKPADNLLPAMETCYSCHPEDDTDCSYCHQNPDAAGEVPRIQDYQAQFPHAVHAEDDEDCLSCHRGVIERDAYDYKAAMQIPERDMCNDCHEQVDFRDERVKCYDCHSREMNFVPESHQLLWNKNHGLASQDGNADCSHCHQVSYCQECHQGDNLDRLAHPLNFINNHGLYARGNKENCLTCHEEFAFCVDCHQTEMVMPKNHSYANWANTTTGGSHAREALYDFDSCTSCHSDAYTDNVCLRCHQN